MVDGASSFFRGGHVVTPVSGDSAGVDVYLRRRPGLSTTPTEGGCVCVCVRVFTCVCVRTPSPFVEWRRKRREGSKYFVLRRSVFSFCLPWVDEDTNKKNFGCMWIDKESMICYIDGRWMAGQPFDWEDLDSGPVFPITIHVTVVLVGQESPGAVAPDTLSSRPSTVTVHTHGRDSVGGVPLKVQIRSSRQTLGLPFLPTRKTRLSVSEPHGESSPCPDKILYRH